MKARAHFNVELIAGLTTFLSMSYIMFVNPAVLAEITPSHEHHVAGLDAGAVFIATCFMAAFATFVAGHVLNKPTALASGMGFNVFVASFATSAGVPWPILVAFCGVAAFAVFLLSRFTRFRQNLITALMESGQIFSAVKGGVGAMLASVALDQTVKFAQTTHHRWWTLTLFVLGLGIILGLRLLCEHIDAKPESTRPAEIFSIIGKSGAFLASILAVLLLIYGFHLSTATNPIRSHLLVTWFDPTVWEETYTFDDILRSMPFFFAVVFMMSVDIAGSPIDHLQFLKAHEGYQPDKRDEEMIRKSFIVDSASNIAVSVSGITPIVYYAENHAGWQAGGRTGRTAVVVGSAFFICGVIGLIFWYLQSPINQFISRFAAMPTLFFVGCWLVADAFANPSALGSFSQFSDDEEGAGDKQSTNEEAATPEGRVFKFLPAAVTTVLASITTLDNAIAGGILADAFVFLFPEAYRGGRSPPRWELMMVYAGALFIIVWATRVKFLAL